MEKILNKDWLAAKEKFLQSAGIKGKVGEMMFNDLIDSLNLMAFPPVAELGGSVNTDLELEIERWDLRSLSRHVWLACCLRHGSGGTPEAIRAYNRIMRAACFELSKSGYYHDNSYPQIGLAGGMLSR